MPGNWRSIIPGMSNVQRLVFQLLQKREDDRQAMEAALTKARRRAYEDELTIQLRRSGCANRHGMLTTGPALSELSSLSRLESESIGNTYNWDLAQQLGKIKADAPRANRHIYAKRLSAWDQNRMPQKTRDIAQWTEGTARARAQRDFARFNRMEGTARLEPTVAACPICAGWIARGSVPLQEAMDNPGPFHVKCPHGWQTFPKRIAAGDCQDLWGGE